MFISFFSKLLKYISIVASLLLGLKVNFGLNLYLWKSFSSVQKFHFKHNILPYSSSSFLSFPFLIWLLVRTYFNSLDNNQVSALVTFRLNKLTTFLLKNLPLIHPLKAITSFLHLNSFVNPHNQLRFVYPRLPRHEGH